MTTYPTLRKAEKLIKAAIPCDDCDCKHRTARLEIQLDGPHILARTLRLNCGKAPLVDFRSEDEEEAEDVVVEEDAEEK